MVDAFKDHALTQEQLDTAQCMLDSMTTREAAKAMGVSTGTAHNRMHDDAVVAYVQAVRAETAEQVAHLRVKGAMIGMRTLIEIATNKKYAPSPRATAAGKLVDVCISRRHEVTGPNGGPVQSVQLDPEKIASMDPEQLRALREALVKL